MAGQGRLKAAVYVQDPATREEVILLPGQTPSPSVAALVANPEAWEETPAASRPEPGGAEEAGSAAEGDPALEPRAREQGDGGAKKSASPRRSRSAPTS